MPRCPWGMTEMVPNYGEPVKSRKSRRLSETQVSRFLKAYGRKAPKRGEPNDRGFSKRVRQQLKQMRPEDVDRLLRGDDEPMPR
jgi:hypothetical protein